MEHDWVRLQRKVCLLAAPRSLTQTAFSLSHYPMVHATVRTQHRTLVQRLREAGLLCGLVWVCLPQTHPNIHTHTHTHLEHAYSYDMRTVLECAGVCWSVAHTTFLLASCVILETPLTITKLSPWPAHYVLPRCAISCIPSRSISHL